MLLASEAIRIGAGKAFMKDVSPEIPEILPLNADFVDFTKYGFYLRDAFGQTAASAINFRTRFMAPLFFSI